MDPQQRDALVQALSSVMATPSAQEFFNHPVDAVALGLHDYHDYVTRPMSLSQVLRRVEACGRSAAATTSTPGDVGVEAQTPYQSFADALDDIRLVWRNCRTYNASPHMAHLRATCDELDEMMRDELDKAGVINIPPPSDLPAEAVKVEATITETDTPEKYNVFLGEQLPYRILDELTVCVCDDAFEVAPIEQADAYDKWVVEIGAVDEDGAVDADGVMYTTQEQSRTRTRTNEKGFHSKNEKKNQPPKRLAAYGWLAVPDANFEPVDDPQQVVSGNIPAPESNPEDDENEAIEKTKNKTTRVKVWLPRILDWSIDYENPQSSWLITPHGWYRCLDPSAEYIQVFKQGVQKKFDLATRAVNALKQDPLGSWDDVLAKVLAPPPKPGRPRGRPPKDRTLEEEKKGKGKGGRGSKGGEGEEGEEGWG